MSSCSKEVSYVRDVKQAIISRPSNGHRRSMSANVVTLQRDTVKSGYKATKQIVLICKNCMNTM